MPKLNKKQAKDVEAADAAGGFEALPEGRYAAQLRSVEERVGKNSGEPYWTWEFHNLHDEDGKSHPGRQWHNTSLSAKSAGFLKQSFEAFGYTADSDTDEMLGEWVVLHIEQEIQQQGKNAGKIRNSISRLSEFEADEWDFDAEAVAIFRPYAEANADSF